MQLKAIVVKQLPTLQNTADQIIVPRKNKAAYEKTSAHSMKSSVSALKAKPTVSQLVQTLRLVL